jgi:outer membrane lipoprotein LolB
LGLSYAHLSKDAHSPWHYLIIKNKRIKAKAAQALLYKATNLNLPVDALAYWIKGQPSPELPINKNRYNEYGLINSLEQGPWQIEFFNYNAHPEHAKIYLPSKILIKNHKESINLKLLIQAWGI